MTPAAAIVAAALLAQASGAGGTRFTVTLRFHGVWGLLTEANGTCPGTTPGDDTLTGIVEPAGSDDEGVRYTGSLARTTNVDLCEVRDTSDGDQWCKGNIKGGGRFTVTITIPPRGRDNENASVALAPGPRCPPGTTAPVCVWARVEGQCQSLDNQSVAHDYTAGDTLYFETSNAGGQSADLVQTGGLTQGRFKQTRRAAPGDPQYTLTVVPAP
jgi:hypothetical protein